MEFYRTSYPEQRINWRGIDIRTVDIGRGAPMVFIHGLGGRIEDNDRIFPFLEDRYRIISMDQPGSGFSGKPDDIDYNMDWLVDFIFDFTRQLGIERFHVAGGSQGGLLTLLCCEKAPERIARAVAYSPSGVWDPNPLTSSLFSVLPPQAVRPMMRITSLFWNSPKHPDYWRNRRDAMAYLEMASELPGYGRHVLGCVSSVFSQDFRERFARVQTPVLLFWGRHDFGMPVTQGRQLSRILPSVRYIEVPDAGHNVFTERPRLCAAAMRRFLDE